MFRDLIEFYSSNFHPMSQSIWLGLPLFMYDSCNKRRTGDWPFCDFGPPEGTLYISDPCSQLEPKNVTYNAFSFSHIQHELRLLYEELVLVENNPADEINQKGDETSYFLGLFNRSTKFIESE